MGQFPIWKLKWDLLRTSVRAFIIHKNIFFAPFGIFYMRTEIWKKKFQKISYKIPSPNGSYRNGVCRALWAQSLTWDWEFAIHILTTSAAKHVFPDPENAKKKLWRPLMPILSQFRFNFDKIQYITDSNIGEVFSLPSCKWL